MNFTFIVKPSTSGSAFTTRPDFGPDWTQAELDARVAAVTGLTAAQCAAAGRQYFLEILQATTPRRALNLFGLLRVAPSCGGTQPAPDGFHTPVDIKADFALGYLADVIRDWRDTMTIEKTGEEGVAAPEIDTVMDVANNAVNHYTVMQNLHILGNDLDFTKAETTQGVFLQPAAGGAWVRLSTYGPITAKQTYVLIPTGITGGQRLKLVNGRGHESVYTNLLLP